MGIRFWAMCELKQRMKQPLGNHTHEWDEKKENQMQYSPDTVCNPHLKEKLSTNENH